MRCAREIRAHRSFLLYNECQMRNKPDEKEKNTGRMSVAVRALAFTLAVAVIVVAGANLWKSYKQKEKAGRVMTQLEKIIPGLGSDTGISMGTGRDQLAALSMEGMDIVGVIEIPSLDIKAPVTGKNISEAEFATWLDGSPVQKYFSIIGGRRDVFRNIARLKPGDNVSFTDTDGVRYNYRVSTQYHMKKWDEGDNDLLICYEAGSDTYFVVGCSATE